LAGGRTGIGSPEIEAVRRWLNQAAKAKGGLPDEVLRKFERLQALAGDPSRQYEAEALANELFQFSGDARHAKPLKIAHGSVRVLITLKPPLLDALNRYMAQREGADNCTKAVRMILEESLASFGSSPEPEPEREAESGCSEDVDLFP
jgi:hypothetical protein